MSEGVLPFVMMFVFVAALLAPGPNPNALYRHDGVYALPNPELTPGEWNPTIVADLSRKPDRIAGVEHNLCALDFRTPPFREATRSEKIKRAVCAKYGIDAAHCIGKLYELDDTDPVELGGMNVEKNLWPQPIKQARIKDHRVEDVLGGPRGLVCQGKISLQAARDCVSTDWVACMARVKQLEK